MSLCVSAFINNVNINQINILNVNRKPRNSANTFFAVIFLQQIFSQTNHNYAILYTEHLEASRPRVTITFTATPIEFENKFRKFVLKPETRIKSFLSPNELCFDKRIQIVSATIVQYAIR